MININGINIFNLIEIPYYIYISKYKLMYTITLMYIIFMLFISQLKFFEISFNIILYNIIIFKKRRQNKNSI